MKPCENVDGSLREANINNLYSFLSFEKINLFDSEKFSSSFDKYDSSSNYSTSNDFLTNGKIILFQNIFYKYNFDKSSFEKIGVLNKKNVELYNSGNLIIDKKKVKKIYTLKVDVEFEQEDQKKNEESNKNILENLEEKKEF